LGIQTKSDLILRDIYVLLRFKKCETGLTITTLDDTVREEVEPYTASVARRIAALEKLKATGLRTYVFTGPIFPFLTDWKAIVMATRHAADFYMFENLNFRLYPRGYPLLA
jgi:DNA repair photolyase